MNLLMFCPDGVSDVQKNSGNREMQVQEKWLIAVDLDGTLFHTDHQISSRTLNIMHRVKENGHSMVILTGRSSHSSMPRLRSIPEDIRLICSNGAYEYDRKQQSIVWSHCLSAAMATSIKHRILDALPAASFGWESSLGLSYDAKFISEAGGAHTLEQGGKKETLGQCDVLKLFVRAPGKKSGELNTMLSRLLYGDAEVSSSGVPFVEITAVGINKGNALSRVACDLGFKSDHTIAFGDNLNDISMLCWAGESVAMGNAINEVKALTSCHTLSNSEDGVAHFLESKFLESC